MSASNVNKQSVVRGIELQYDTLLVGLQTLSPTQQLSIESVSYTPATLSTLITQMDSVHKTVRSLRVQLQTAIGTRRTQKPRDRQLIAAVRATIVGLLGDESPDLVNFGFKPRRTRTPATVEEKALAVARAKDTREKRGTLGAKQKAAIHGDQPQSVTVTPAGGMTISATPTPT